MELDEDRNQFEVIIGPQKYKVLPNDFYKARLIKVQSGIGKFGPIFRLFFEITEGEKMGTRINGLVNKDASGIKGRLWQLFKAMTGKATNIFTTFNLKDLVGKECFIHVEEREKGNAITEYVGLRDFENIKRIRLEA
ncbi:MAG: hypothetical protein WC530_08420 [Candidatus Omnitrophota bacterium]|jgi:hypothetical protein